MAAAIKWQVTITELMALEGKFARLHEHHEATESLTKHTGQHRSRADDSFRWNGRVANGQEVANSCVFNRRGDARLQDRTEGVVRKMRACEELDSLAFKLPKTFHSTT